MGGGGGGRGGGGNTGSYSWDCGKCNGTEYVLCSESALRQCPKLTLSCYKATAKLYSYISSFCLIDSGMVHQFLIQSQSYYDEGGNSGNVFTLAYP